MCNFSSNRVFQTVMKTQIPKHRFTIPLLSLSLLALPGLMAQTDQGTNSTSQSTVSAGTNQPVAEGWHHHGPGGAGFANLTPAERQQIKADFAQIKDNPQLVAAREAVKQAMQSLEQTRQTLLLQVDPSVQPILTKIQQARQTRQTPGDS
jgi:Spy/CpxP family protein refolding chaperone